MIGNTNVLCGGFRRCFPERLCSLVPQQAAGLAFVWAGLTPRGGKRKRRLKAGLGGRRARLSCGSMLYTSLKCRMVSFWARGVAPDVVTVPEAAGTRQRRCQRAQVCNARETFGQPGMRMVTVSSFFCKKDSDALVALQRSCNINPVRIMASWGYYLASENEALQKCPQDAHFPQNDRLFFMTS